MKAGLYRALALAGALAIAPAAKAADCFAADFAQFSACITGAAAGDLVILTANITMGAMPAVNVDVNVINNGFTLTGGGSLTKTGAGTLVLLEANTYTGGTTITQGLVLINHGGALGTGDITMNGGSLFSLGSMTVSPANFVFASGTSSQVSANAATTLTLSPTTLSIQGNASFGNSGAGTVLLQPTGGAFNAAGTLTVALGKVTVGSAAASTITAGVASVSVNGGAELDLGANALTIGNLLGGGVVRVTSPNALTLSAGDFSGEITGTGSVTKSGTGNLLLIFNTNTYTGGTTISGGLALIGNAAVFGTGNVNMSGGGLVTLASMSLAPPQFNFAAGTTSSVSSVAGETLTLSAPAINFFNAAVARFGDFGAGTVAVGPGGGSTLGTEQIVVASGTLTTTGTRLSFLTSSAVSTTVDLGAFLNSGAFDLLVGNLLGAGTVTINGGQVLTLVNGSFSGVVAGGGNLVIASGSTALTGDNTYTGTTTINAGGTLTIGAGAGTGLLGAGNVTDNGILVINRSGTYTISQVISGTGQLQNIGPGTITLSAANTYSGTTTHSAGILYVTGSIAASSSTVAAGAILGGSGTTGALAIQGSGLLFPGLSPGIINTGNLDLQANAILYAEINGATVGTQYDQVNVTGSVSLGSSLIGPALGFTPLAGTVFTIINNDGADAVTGTFAGVPEGGVLPLGTVELAVSYVGGDGNDVILTTVTGIPLAPVILTATGQPSAATVTFDPPAFPGSLPLTYTAQCGTQTASGSGSPLVVTGLANGVPVDCVVRATNANGTSADSAIISITPSYTVFSGPDPGGAGTITASFTGGGATCSFLTDPEFIPVEGHAKSPPTGSKPPGTTFPFGLFDFTTINCAGSITMTVVYPGPLPTRTRYWKYGPTPGNATPHWYPLPASISGSTIVFTIADGGLGDDDLTANGTIVDQGGPGSADAGRIPTLSQWMLLLLATLMIAAAALRRRNGKRERA